MLMDSDDVEPFSVVQRDGKWFVELVPCSDHGADRVSSLLVLPGGPDSDVIVGMNIGPFDTEQAAIEWSDMGRHVSYPDDDEYRMQ